MSQSNDALEEELHRQKQEKFDPILFDMLRDMPEPPTMEEIVTFLDRRLVKVIVDLEKDK